MKVAAISNPNPSKKIEKLIFSAPLEGGIYALLGITLADREHYVKPPVESTGLEPRANSNPLCP